MVLTKFQKLSTDSSKYNYYEFSAFVSVSPVVNDACIYYKTPSFKNNNQWIVLYGDNNEGFSIGIVLNETELKKMIKEDLKEGCTLYGTQGDINDLIFKKLKIPKSTSNLFRTVAHKPVRKTAVRKIKRA